MEIVFVDLEWPREVKHNVDTDLSELYRRNVNNRELNHVWISSHSLLCKRYGSSFLLKKRLISVLLFNFRSKINWKWFVFVVRGQKLDFLSSSELAVV